MSKLAVLFMLFLLLLTGAIFQFAHSASPALAKTKEEKIPDQYIVVLKDNENPDQVAADLENNVGISKRHVYKAALKGFSATITADKLDKVRQDKRVLFVSENKTVSIEAGDGLKGDYFDNSDLTNLKLTRVDP